jgi:tetraacyldisaccharide 4'-kinase
LTSAGLGALADAWYRGDAWLWLLRPVELLFRTVVFLRRSLYRGGLLPVYRAEKPVVVVGNVTVGGTGKTPVIIALVEGLQAAGLRPGVVSRGYGATGGVFPHRVGAGSTAADCGDEPLLIYRRTGCPCVVDPDRPAAVRALLQEEAVDLVLSDDGLQHYALGRELEIAVVDAGVGLGNGFCLPAGPLREPPARLRQVDYVLHRGGEDPATSVRYRLETLVHLTSGTTRPLSPRGLSASVYAVAGIGRPQSFFDTLSGAGFRVVPRVFPDHHAYDAGDFAGLGDRPVIMTEKDAVKCAGIAGDNAWYLRISAELPSRLLEAVIALARP